MTAYAVAHMRQATMGPQIVEYLHRIDATLESFGGRFLVHGGDVEVIENDWPGHLIIIEFPDRQHVHGWYNSPAYQAILALRTGIRCPMWCSLTASNIRTRRRMFWKSRRSQTN
ncbi:uncharacterized protein (DUF1330 family) [Mesorhizobium loti]|uniref:Uncharacterized protein (DUF1330 family) n=1 Tax=Rhizobium loti TaxID=381 RepID=A0A8E3B2I7_RHILI|nr:uncharacterized protein (DUF1330 family) [Mesorhizobium loti]